MTVNIVLSSLYFSTNTVLLFVDTDADGVTDV